ncbi:hypothetical protein HPT27_16355 [Permianibacter sp. IMCC34836]|uniref:hypothetical protein n=1 Tax=Permianibacter fluminis TaxID=2738515 RepID=UPI00155522EF|nr:hypothetical protein [Permianibacter fluminis]NQD38597.1 hypothetical protein [Permianibacter fluminis]
MSFRIFLLADAELRASALLASAILASLLAAPIANASTPNTAEKKAATPNTAIPATSMAADGQLFCAELSISRRQQRADGVELTERYRERLYRTDNVIAFERVRPQVAEPSEPAAKSAHSHPDGMVRRYERLADGSIAYSLFDDRTQQEIRLLPSEFADFGFDGDFRALHTLADAATLTKLGAGDQHLREPDRELRWSGREQIVRYQHQRWASGEQTITVTPIAHCADPRMQRQQFARIDYADTLD